MVRSSPRAACRHGHGAQQPECGLPPGRSLTHALAAGLQPMTSGAPKHDTATEWSSPSSVEHPAPRTVETLAILRLHGPIAPGAQISGRSASQRTGLA
eukprot:2446757-Alexandrium_andersonii.AAC.1